MGVIVVAEAVIEYGEPGIDERDSGQVAGADILQEIGEKRRRGQVLQPPEREEGEVGEVISVAHAGA